jgi:O-antigen chain-terminating methyltransferase
MKKLSVWLTAIEEHLGALTGRWVDIGCGRGEWLSMSSRHGHDAHGIDLNPAAVLQCRSRNLNAEVIGAIEYLERNEDGSLAVITAFHVAEHLPSGELLRFVAVAARKLQPNGLLAIETPNPANLLMGAHHFWNDPTHQRPIPEALMRFAFEYFGLKVIRRLSLSPFPAEQHLAFSEIEVVRQLDDHLYGARDYGLLGCRCD